MGGTVVPRRPRPHRMLEIMSDALTRMFKGKILLESSRYEQVPGTVSIYWLRQQFGVVQFAMVPAGSPQCKGLKPGRRVVPNTIAVCVDQNFRIQGFKPLA